MVGRARSWKRVALVVGLFGGTVFFAGAEPASAACHRFSIEASPARVSEGATVSVKITRDGRVDPSSVDVETIDDTARAGQDYAAMKETISFTDETSQTLNIPIVNDTANERDETFKIHMSNPAGCPANTNFDIGDDVDVTIAASDAPGVAAATTVTGAAPAAPSTTALPPVTPVPTTDATNDLLPDVEDKDGGISDGAIVAAVIVVLAAAAAGLIARRRRAATGDAGGPDAPVR